MDELECNAPLLLSFRCPVKWESMEGDSGSRRCEQCSCTVQDISNYSKPQIQALLARVDAGEEICVAYSVRPAVAAVASSGLVSGAVAEPLARPLPGESRRAYITLAVSISLIYFFPIELAPAFAQEPTQKETLILLGPECPQAHTKHRKSDLTPLPTGRVKLAPEEHGMWMGRPAPNKLRDLVNEVVYCPDSKLPEAKAFEAELEKGWISPDHLEKLAKASERSGWTGKARKSYLLLLALGDRAHISHPQMQSYREKVLSLGPKEFASELELFDQSIASKKFSGCVDHLIAANNVRNSAPELSQQLPWAEVAARMDKLKPQYAAISNNPYTNYPETALELASREKSTQAIEQWRQMQREFAIQLFEEKQDLSDQELSKHKYNKALECLERAVELGSIDRTIVRRCNWDSLATRLQNLEAHGDESFAADCERVLNTVKRIRSNGGRTGGWP